MPFVYVLEEQPLLTSRSKKMVRIQRDGESRACLFEWDPSAWRTRLLLWRVQRGINLGNGQAKIEKKKHINHRDVVHVL
jgi:hypothetical protein